MSPILSDSPATILTQFSELPGGDKPHKRSNKNVDIIVFLIYK